MRSEYEGMSRYVSIYSNYSQHLVMKYIRLKLTVHCPDLKTNVYALAPST